MFPNLTPEGLQYLHSPLSGLEGILARKTVPADWEADGIEEIHMLQEIIEQL